MLPPIFTFHRYNDGSVKLRNPNIELMDQDILYHLALGSGSHDLHEMFGDVKVPGSSPKRYKIQTPRYTSRACFLKHTEMSLLV